MHVVHPQFHFTFWMGLEKWSPPRLTLRAQHLVAIPMSQGTFRPTRSKRMRAKFFAHVGQAYPHSFAMSPPQSCVSASCAAVAWCGHGEGCSKRKGPKNGRATLWTLVENGYLGVPFRFGFHFFASLCVLRRCEAQVLTSRCEAIRADPISGSLAWGLDGPPKGQPRVGFSQRAFGHSQFPSLLMFNQGFKGLTFCVFRSCVQVLCTCTVESNLRSSKNFSWMRFNDVRWKPRRPGKPRHNPWQILT